jgi:hypothetical protein
MPDFKHTERITRRQAAERLTDVAYALVVRSPVLLQIEGESVVAPDSDELLVEWDVSCADGLLQLQLEVRPPTTELLGAEQRDRQPQGEAVEHPKGPTGKILQREIEAPAEARS